MMCGIVGVAGDLLIKHERAFSDLLVMNQLRGFDSIGVVRVGVQSRPDVVKTLLNSPSFIASSEYKKLLVGANRVFIGHNRAATIGDVNVENAHPFTHGYITGVHNGTISFRQDLLDHHKFKVDSDNLFYHIFKKGVKDLWPKVWGAASLVWWNSAGESLNFLRNKERPMYIAYDKEHKVVMWASEFYMLMAAASRNGIILDGSPVATEINKLYTFSFNNYKRGEVLKALQEPIDDRPVINYVRKQRPAIDIGYNGMPSWLRVGNVVDCLFESQYLHNNFWKFEGWSPLDDRVNIEYSIVKVDGVPPVINLFDKTKVYRGTINQITRAYRGGILEFDVKVVGIHEAVKVDGSPLSLEESTNKEEKKKAADKEWDELMAEMGEDSAPFDKADTVCSVLCTFKSQEFCKKCRQAFFGRLGTWTSKHERLYHCDWCGGVHGENEIVYVTEDKEESYCQDCFKNVINHLVTRRQYN